MYRQRFSLTLINLLFSLVEFLIGLRILLKLFGAYTGAPFVRWIYETTQPLLYPFIGMFPSPRLTGGFVIEFSAVFAMIAYALVAYIIEEAIETMTYREEMRRENRKEK